MAVTAKISRISQTIRLPLSQLRPNHFSLSIYGDPAAEIDDLLPSIRDHGILVALVVAPGLIPDTWEVISGHRRLACAQAVDQIPPSRGAAPAFGPTGATGLSRNAGHGLALQQARRIICSHDRFAFRVAAAIGGGIPIR